MLKLAQCPFGRGNRQLTQEDLTPKNKRWLANAVIIGGITQPKLVARFGLNKHTLKEWVIKVREGGRMEALLDFTCGDKGTQPTKVVYTSHRPKQLKTEPTTVSSGVCYFIKYYATINAAGDQARSIYILADDNMLPGEIDVKEVTGIGSGASSKDISYFVFCKTRCPTIEFYKWYVRIVFIPWVQELREHYEISAEVPAYFQLDEDAAQIAPFLFDTQIRELCNEHNVLVGKPSGSSTEITQALDAGPCFETSKYYLKPTSDADVTSHWRLPRLKQVWAEHTKWMKDRGRSTAISDKQRKSGTHGVLRIHECQQRAFHSKAIRESFKKTGLYPLDDNVIFKSCTGNITPEEQMRFLEILKPLCRLFMKQGEIFEEDFDRYDGR
ncbi:hypothetical protein B484DRAFT_402841 [Ochromonadaceae sp. CCMP2298]|nr:hypothetical protein B484DRAFT_402841 [Ochromonadaceae sp. CCMP2298]